MLYLKFVKKKEYFDIFASIKCKFPFSQFFFNIINSKCSMRKMFSPNALKSIIAICHYMCNKYVHVSSNINIIAKVKCSQLQKNDENMVNISLNLDFF